MASALSIARIFFAKGWDFLEPNKKPGSEVANPHAGFLNINRVSPLRGAISHQLSAVSRELMAEG